MKEKLIEVLNSKSVTILGHDNYDVDSIISSVLLSKLLNYINIENKIVILQDIKENDTYKMLMEKFNINLYDFYSDKEDSSRKLILVDHYETSHLGDVIACIDHHPTEKKNTYPFYICKKSCSTSYIIYELMKEFDYNINREEAEMIVFSMMIDTVAFRSEKTVKKEVVFAKALARQYDINYDELEKYSLCLTPIEKMEINDIITYGIKKYCFNESKVNSSYLQLLEVPKVEIQEWLKIIQSKIKESDIKMWVFIVYDCKNNDTYEYHITSENIMSRITFNKILSRGQNIMPRIEKIFN